jgi:hypothetical protein
LKLVVFFVSFGAKNHKTMKTIRLFLTGMMAIATLGLVSCSSPNAVAKNERAQAVKKQIEDRHYTIKVNRMLPMSGRARELTTTYSLTINGDTINSHLPYFGTAYSVPYGGGQGLVFEAPITVYSMNFDAKGAANISIQTRSEDDSYTYRIQIFDNGSTTIYVTPSNRQAITFYGNVEL